MDDVRIINYFKNSEEEYLKKAVTLKMENIINQEINNMKSDKKPLLES